MTTSHAELMERDFAKSKGKKEYRLETLLDKEGDYLSRRFKGIESEVHIEYGEDVQEYAIRYQGAEYACR
jgi:hypothetical protein